MEDKNKGISNTLSIALIFILMLAAGFGVYFISSRVSQEQAIAPTAPESQPLAGKNEGGGCCKAGSKACRKSETCNSSCECKKNAPEPTGYGENYTCTSTNCPGPCFSCNSTRTSCIAHPNAAGCGEVSTGIGGDPNNCGGKGNTCPSGATCKNGVCEKGGTTVPSLPPSTPSPTGSGPTPETGLTKSACLNQDGTEACPAIDCHCLYGDVCSAQECDADLKLTCRRQGRSWCINQYGKAMTCCAVGYTCNPSGNGCVQTGPTGTTPPKKSPTPTGKTTPTPPPAVCVDTVLFIPQETATACTTDNDCSSLNRPEGQFCKTSTGKCNTWQVATAAQVSANGKVGDRVKAAFTASNTTIVEVKVNQGAFEKAVKNTATGKWDFVFNIPNSGNFNIQARYLRNQ